MSLIWKDCGLYSLYHNREDEGDIHGMVAKDGKVDLWRAFAPVDHPVCFRKTIEEAKQAVEEACSSTTLVSGN